MMRKAERDKGSKESDEKGVQRVQDINIDPKVLDCAFADLKWCRTKRVNDSMEIITSDQGCDMINDRVLTHP